MHVCSHRNASCSETRTMATLWQTANTLLIFIQFILCVSVTHTPFNTTAMRYSCTPRHLQIDIDPDNVHYINSQVSFLLFKFFFLLSLEIFIRWICFSLLFVKLLINANWFRISTIDDCHRCQDTLWTNFTHIIRNKIRSLRNAWNSSSFPLEC